MKRWVVGLKRKTGTYNPNFIYEEDSENMVAQIFAIPLHKTREEVESNPQTAKSLKVADEICASHNELEARARFAREPKRSKN